MSLKHDAPNGQTGRTEPFYFLELACEKTAEKFGTPNMASWTNGDFVRLSQALFDVTRAQISVNTLKRIFGKIRTDERYYPQQATRDSMAQYIGFRDWDAFVRESTPYTETTTPLSRLLRSWLIWMLLALAGALTIFISRGFFASPPADLPFRITCRNPNGTVPYSAVFDLHITDVEKMRKGNYSLQFGDGKRRKLEWNKTFYSHYYEQPGRFFAVVERNGKEVADTIPIYLPTKGWTVRIEQAHDSLRLYSAKLPARIQQLKLASADVRNAGVDTTDIFTIKFINAYETGISGDNFELETNVTTSPEYIAHRCSVVNLWLFGKRSLHVIQITRPGCQHWGYRSISEKSNWGQNEEMSYLASDLQHGGALKLVVRDKKMSFFINGRKSFDETYSFSLEQIYSVRIDFVGVGSVNSFYLKDLRTGKLFDGNFDGVSSKLHQSPSFE